MIYEWPTPKLCPRIVDLRIIARTRSAGESLTGFEQVAASINDRWAFTLEFGNLKRDAILPYRALIASLGGRGNAVRVPIWDHRLWPADMAIGIVNVPARGDPWRTVDDGAAVRDVAATISGLTGEKAATVDLSAITKPELVLFPGHYFGAGDDLHIITAIEWTGASAAIAFEPGFRRDHTASAFKLRPSLICRLAADESGAHPMERGLITAPAMDLVEILPDELAAGEVAP